MMISLTSVLRAFGRRPHPFESRSATLPLFTFLFFVAAILAVRHQLQLLNYIQNGDESETIVAAKMIAAGGILYKDIFNHHGPLIFLPGILLEHLGHFGVPVHRIPIAVLQCIALSSIYYSPVLRNAFLRKAYTIVAATIMLCYFPEQFGHMYVYQVLAGLFLLILLSQLTIPALFPSDVVCQSRVIIGNVLISCLPFLSITYLPAAIFLFFASLRKETLSTSLVSLAAGITGNLTFLGYSGSYSGYFAYHIYLNYKILPSYIYGTAASPFPLLVRAAIDGITSSIFSFLIFLSAVAASSRLAVKEGSITGPAFPWRAPLVLLALGTFLIRGQGPAVGQSLHALPYFYALLALLLVFFDPKESPSRPALLFWLLVAVVCILKLSLVLPADRERLQSNQIPSSTDFAALVRLLTEPRDKIIAYSFENYEYIAADRLPASGYFFYLPWQEKYNETPILGINIDACEDIKRDKPKVMLINKWRVWDRFPWESYAGCVQGVIDSDYIQVPNKPYYIRKDIYSSDIGIASPDSKYTMRVSQVLGMRSSIPISLTYSGGEEVAGLRRIGIRFATYLRRNSGEAELRLKGPHGFALAQRFSLYDLADNQYRYFSLDSKPYTTGEIVALSGGGVSTWESKGENALAHTCIIYEYSDGKKRFTPGCPLF